MSKIEWTDVTWNPTTGCDRISPGCDNCYALKLAGRLKAMGQEKYQNDGDPRTSGPGFALTIHLDTLDAPLRWRKPRKVFVNSMSDLFHPDVPESFIGEVFDVMLRCPQHTFQVLTKRPQRIAELVGRFRTLDGASWYIGDGGDPMKFPNVWLGTSIETDRYTFRADHLRDTPAAVRFLSLEPLLGPLPSLDLTGIDWVIVGGESGPGARPMHPDWVRSIRDRCIEAGVPFFFKQWGAWNHGSVPGKPDHVVLTDGRALTWPEWKEVGARMLTRERITAQPQVMARVGKKAAGNELDGRTWEQMPA